MRGDNDVGHRDQPRQDVVLDDVSRKIFKEEVGLFLVNVKASGTYVSRFDGCEERLSIDQCSARSVDQDYTATAKRQRFFINHVVGLLGEGTMQRDDVTAGKQFGQVNVTNGVAVVKSLCREFVICQHLHAKAAADVDKHAADLTRANDANGLAVQVETCHIVETKIEIARANICLVDATNGRE